ncbi:MAG: amino acid permease [Deltaproteobacteria bacterium]|nr:amino acid permease [Deltaproteobacteria bacterium]
MSKNLSRDEQIRKDAADLHRWGYVQQLFRDMGGFSNFAISFSIISVITGAATLYGHGITWGGPMVYGWGWPIVTFFTLFVVASMAEIASAYPTAGAMYHWASVLGGPGWGWFTAWFNFIGQVAVLAGVDYGIALFLAPLLGLPETQTSLLSLYAIVLVSHGLFNHYGIRIVAWLNDFSVVYHILGTLLLIGALLWFAPLTTEETVDPKRNAPWGMFLAVLISGVIGFLMNLVTTLAIQDLSLTTSSANPYLYIFETALGELFGRIILWMVLGAMWFCGLSALTSSARMLFAFSRDRGLPGWRFLSQISVAHKTPAQATWVLVVLAFLIAIYSKSYSAIVSISVIGLYISYILPVILGFKARLRGKWRDRGPWHLGRWSLVINGVAIAWVGFISVLFVVPPNELAGYTFAGLLLLLTLYYFVWTRKHFKGPKQSS